MTGFYMKCNTGLKWVNILLILFEDWDCFETVTKLVADGLVYLYADSEMNSKLK